MTAAVIGRSERADDYPFVDMHAAANDPRQKKSHHFEVRSPQRDGVLSTSSRFRDARQVNKDLPASDMSYMNESATKHHL